MNPSQITIEIILKEGMDERWSAWFEGLSISSPKEGPTRLYGPIHDRAALHGYLELIRDLNLKLISVKVEEK